MVLMYLSQFEGKGTLGWPNTDNCGSQLLAFCSDIDSYKTKLNSGDPFIGAADRFDDSS